MNWLIYIIFIILYILVTFFGLGPVIFTDGSNLERIVTFLFIVVIYVFLTVILQFLIKQVKMP